jgi:anaerobic selenocysteine-containing dehydrogenase
MNQRTPAPHTRQVVGACALDCPDACSWVVTVTDGKAVALRGNPDHPFTRGGLCAKVNPYLNYAASPDRLLYPMRRVGAKGEGRFERVSWDDALAILAEHIQDAARADGPESVWPYAGTGSIGMLQGLGGAGQRLFHHLGASRHFANICSVTGHAGLRLTTGSAMGLDPEDLAHSGLIVLWGTNTLTTNLHLWPFITAGRDRGAPLVVIDPVRTRTAARADLHLAPRPGTDGALALGVMAQLVVTGATDEEYLARATLGWPQFRHAVLAEWSLERAAVTCGVPVEQLHEFVELLATRRPVGVRTLMGVQRHGGAGQALRLISCLPAVMGDYARHGGGLCYSTGPAYGWNLEELTRPDLQPNGPTRELVMSWLGHELLERTEPPVRVLVMWAANPVVSNPDNAAVRAGLAREDLFTAVIEHRLTDTAAYGDLVLPGTMQHEHDDLVESYSHLFVNWNTKAVDPPGECLPHTEIFRRLARHLGVTEPAVLACDDELARDCLDSEDPSMKGLTLESLRARGWQRLEVPRPFLPFGLGFPTPSGRFEFTSERARAEGQGWLPDYRPPREAVTNAGAAAPATMGRALDDDGLVLVSAANHYLINSTFAASPRHARSGVTTVTVHPADAAVRGFENGEQVCVVNSRGSFTAVLAVSDSVRQGVAATSKGILPAPGAGSSVNATTSDALSGIGGGAVFHDNRVWLKRLDTSVGVKADDLTPH